MIRIGILERVEPGKAWIKIPALAPHETWGPCRIVEGLGSLGIAGLASGPGGAPAHTHPLTATRWTVGDAVVVAPVGTSRDEWIVIGRLET